MRASQVAHDERVAEQETDAFRDEHKIRSGIEATNSELKRAPGFGQLRVRRLPKVRMKATLKAIGCNIKRWMKALLEREEGPLPGLGVVSFVFRLLETMCRRIRAIAARPATATT